MSTQPEALKLAEKFSSGMYTNGTAIRAALELCRQHAEIEQLKAQRDELLAALRFYADPKRYQGANQKPIPDDPYTDKDAPYMQDVTRDEGRLAKAAIAKVDGREMTDYYKGIPLTRWFSVKDDGPPPREGVWLTKAKGTKSILFRKWIAPNVWSFGSEDQNDEIEFLGLTILTITHYRGLSRPWKGGAK